MCNHYSDYNGVEFGIVVEAPNLEKLDLDDFLTENFEVNGLSSLVEVKLDLYQCIPGIDYFSF